MEFFQQKLVDSLERKEQKASSSRGRRPSDAKPADKKRAKLATSGIKEHYALKPDELKGDVEEILRNVDHYSVRSAALASDEMRSIGSGEAWYDRTRNLIHCSNYSLERGKTVRLTQHGQRVDGRWTITAMNAQEVTLRDSDGTKLKVTLAQLKNQRCVLRPA